MTANYCKDYTTLFVIPFNASVEHEIKAIVRNNYVMCLRIYMFKYINERIMRKACMSILLNNLIKGAWNQFSVGISNY